MRGISIRHSPLREQRRLPATRVSLAVDAELSVRKDNDRSPEGVTWLLFTTEVQRVSRGHSSHLSSSWKDDNSNTKVPVNTYILNI